MSQPHVNQRRNHCQVRHRQRVPNTDLLDELSINHEIQEPRHLLAFGKCAYQSFIKKLRRLGERMVGKDFCDNLKNFAIEPIVAAGRWHMQRPVKGMRRNKAYTSF
jgi:hypothetical protein